MNTYNAQIRTGNTLSSRRPSSSRYFALLLSLLPVCILCDAAEAQNIVISTLTQPISSDFTTSFTTPSDLRAQAFNNGIAAYLSEVTLSLRLRSLDVSTADTVSLFLYNNGNVNPPVDLNPNEPASQLTSLGSVVVNSTVSQNYVFTPVNAFQMLRGGSYWLVAQDDANSNALWDFTTSGFYQGGGGAAIPFGYATASSGDLGASWIVSGPGDGLQVFQVESSPNPVVAVATPEAGTLVLLPLGFCTAGFLTRRYRSHR